MKGGTMQSKTFLPENGGLLESSGDTEVTGCIEKFKSMSELEARKFMYELQVRRIELEAQNEELLRIEEELSQSRYRYAVLYQRAPLGYLTLDREFAIMESNSAASALLGTCGRRLRGTRLADYAAADEREACREFLLNIVLEGRCGTAEVRFSGSGDSQPVVRIRAEPFLAGNMPEVLVILCDITAEYCSREAILRSEKRYKFLFEQSEMLNLILNAEGTVLDVNLQALHRLGYEKEEVLGQPFTNFLEPGQRRNAAIQFKKLSEGGTMESVDLEVYAKDGSLRTFMMAPGSEMIRETGKRPGFMISAIDVTRRKSAEMELQQRIEELAAVNMDLEAFGHSVSHDLRNPINNILVLIEALDKNRSFRYDEKEKLWIREIAKCGQRISSIITDLLRFARIGRQELIFEHLDLNSIANQIVEELRREKTHGEVRVWIQEKMPAFADRGLIYIALYNLLDNAWKYTGYTQIPIIEVGCYESAGTMVYFVRDNGEGYDPRHAKDLFRPFSRLNTTHFFEGTGIGLSLVNRIIIRHHGSLWSEGAPGKGAVFFFTLEKRETPPE